MGYKKLMRRMAERRKANRFDSIGSFEGINRILDDVARITVVYFLHFWVYEKIVLYLSSRYLLINFLQFNREG